MKTALRSYWRYMGLMLLAGLVFAVSMGIYTYYYEPDIYESAVGLYVLPSTGDAESQSSGKTSEMLLGDAKELIRAPEVLYKAEEKLWPDGLEDTRIELEGVSGTHFLRIRAYGTDPGLCQRVATAVSVVFMEQMQTVVGVESISVSERAQEPDEPVGPRRIQKILLTFACAFVGSSLLFLLFAPKKHRITAADARRGGFELPVLGSVADYRRDIPIFLNNKKNEFRILSQYVNRSTIEDVKTLSIALSRSMEEGPRSLVFASCQADEGKSTLSVLLASELSDQGKRVLLVDMDCYAPALGRLLCTRGIRDLLHYLGGEATLDQIILPTLIPNLYFIDNLHPQSLTARMAASSAFAGFLRQMEEEFDYVLFDAPPMSLFADAAALGSVLGGTLLVVAEGCLTMDQLKDAAFRLKSADNRLQGLVFTNVSARKPRRNREDAGASKARVR